MAVTRAYLRAVSESHSHAGEILTRLNRFLCKDTRSEHFVTLFFAKLNPQTGTIAYASAGHTGFHLDAHGDAEELPSTGLILGIDSETTIGEGDSVCLKPGEILLLMTDGIPEIRSPDGELFGNERVFDVVRGHRHATSQTIIEQLYASAREFSDHAPQDDDITALIIKADIA